MPRTKQTSKKAIKSKGDQEIVHLLLNQVKREEAEQLAELEAIKQQQLDAWHEFQAKELAKFPSFLLKKTVKEIKNGVLSETLSSNFTSLMDSTASSKESRGRSAIRKNQTFRKRTTSLVNEDEGYTTSESGRGTSGDRQAKAKVTKNSRVTRSLSRTTRKGNEYKTPANMKTSNNCVGTITPKVKQGVPQVILRRPKQGEMALSYQGSPLLTGPVVTENVANLNIPLPDGNLLSLLPQKGLRTSQIPDVDGEMRRQLEILRDNLIRVCNEVKK